jgi:hypothetical protein
MLSGMLEVRRVVLKFITEDLTSPNYSSLILSTSKDVVPQFAAGIKKVVAAKILDSAEISIIVELLKKMVVKIGKDGGMVVLDSANMEELLDVFTTLIEISTPYDVSIQIHQLWEELRSLLFTLSCCYLL